MTQLELPGIAKPAFPRAGDNGRAGNPSPATPVRPFRMLDEVVRLILVRMALQTGADCLERVRVMRRVPAEVTRIDLRPLLA